MTWTILEGDVLAQLRTLPDEHVQCVVTSPPYWGLRDYGVDGQIGLEESLDEHMAKLVEVFREVRRVLRSDGVAFVNYGDSYAGAPNGGQGRAGALANRSAAKMGVREGRGPGVPQGLKPKDLIGMPWMLAFALRADGWWLRQEIIWHKPNPMPESCRDRPTKAHEQVFLFSKSARYFWDREAVLEPYAESTLKQFEKAYTGTARKDFESSGAQNASDVKRRIVEKQRGHGRRHDGFSDRWDAMEASGDTPSGRNCRSVWTIPTQPTAEAHFATFPEELVARCLKAGSRRDSIVLDPFAGSGTTLLVAERLGRDSIGIELNPAYVEIAKRRISAKDPLAPVNVAPGVVQRSLFSNP